MTLLWISGFPWSLGSKLKAIVVAVSDEKGVGRRNGFKTGGPGLTLQGKESRQLERESWLFEEEDN